MVGEAVHAVALFDAVNPISSAANASAMRAERRADQSRKPTMQPEQNFAALFASVRRPVKEPLRYRSVHSDQAFRAGTVSSHQLSSIFACVHQKILEVLSDRCRTRVWSVLY